VLRATAGTQPLVEGVFITPPLVLQLKADNEQLRQERTTSLGGPSGSASASSGPTGSGAGVSAPVIERLVVIPRDQGEAKEEIKFRPREEQRDPGHVLAILKELYGCSQSYVAAAAGRRCQQPGHFARECDGERAPPRRRVNSVAGYDTQARSSSSQQSGN
ncbi:hypothetical protein D4764_17G0006670, partial [Takifugu flavidus]